MTKRILSILLAMLMLAGAMMTATVTAAETSPYTDVKPKRWSYADIMYVTENGLMNGTGEGIFAPAETMTRAMVVTVLYRLQGEPEVNTASQFTDVKAGKWFTNAVIWASENDIVNGMGNGKFAPMDTITREQLATIIMRYAPKEYIITEERADITGYADYKRVHDYAREALSWTNAVGLITGVTEDTLAPREGATREQFAAILRRFKEYDSYKYELVYNTPVYEQDFVKPEYAIVDDADVYVAVDGDDANPGTLDKPIRTFEKALELVRGLKATKTTGGIKVAFKAGEYGGLNNVTFTAEDTGSAECPITYCAYGDGPVSFDGGFSFTADDFVPLTDSEKALFDKEYADDIMKVDLSAYLDELTSSNIIFNGGSVLYEARYPDKASDGSDKYFTDFTTRYEEEGKDESEYDKLICQGAVSKTLEGFSTYEGLKITGYLRYGWLVDTFPIGGYDKDNKLLTIDFANAEFKNGYPDVPLAFEDRFDDMVFFHNIPELLNVKDEYWFDQDTCCLYTYKPEGEYSVARNGTMITVSDTVSHVSFVGLEFYNTTENTIDTWGDYITFDSCKFGYIGGSHCIYSFSVKDLQVYNSEFFCFINTGIKLDGDSDMKLLTPENQVIRNNYFHDYGDPNVNSNAIMFSYTVDGIIENNVFRNAVHGAVYFRDTVNLVIQNNVFDNMMTGTKDWGAVYTYRDVTLRDNVIRNNLFLNMTTGVTGERYGIYLDGSFAVEIYGNLFYNCGGRNIVFNGGRENDVHDNITISLESHHGNFLLYNEGAYQVILDGGVVDSDQQDVFNKLAGVPQPGSAGYETWSTRWPILYQYNYDLSSVGEYESIYTTVNTIKRNKLFRSKADFGSICELFGIVEDNEEHELSDNPYFADPTHGDYTIVNGKDGFNKDYIFDFSAVGRK